MFGFKKQNHDVIKVSFFETNTEKPFACSDVPAEQLPDTFEINTTMHLGDEDWHVIAAEPAKKEDFCKSGELKITLTKAETTTVDPKDILFSLTTINDELPAVENAKSLENAAVFREDDWRQCEFIAKEYKVHINDEFKAIADIYKNHREGNSGFTKLHIRQVITTPLADKRLTLDDIKAGFTIKKSFSGVAFNTAAAKIKNGFACVTDADWVLWGQIDDGGRILFLNLSPTSGEDFKELAQSVDVFTQKHELFFVDWDRLFWSDADTQSFSEYRG